MFHENTNYNVGAALLRGDLPVTTGRRSEIGSYILTKAAIFIRAGGLEKVMGTFIKNDMLLLPSQSYQKKGVQTSASDSSKY